jgi:cytochrome oxidase Cu insertion factor (SCO1/SenC/PrrC family)/thiol-disulfide isomerase/thioredoxin
MTRLALTLVLLAIAAAAMPVQEARADGDPGSDVLVYQPLFLAADAGVSIPQQVSLDRLLGAAERSRFPIRVAIVARPSDLGAITGLWLKPRAYARFLGIELSLGYRGRLLVVMPNGFGFNWPRHPAATAYRTLSTVKTRAGGTDLATAAQSAVKALAAGAGVKLASPTASSPPAAHASQGAASTRTQGPRGARTDAIVAAVAAALLAGYGLVLLARRRRRRRRRPGQSTSPRLGARLLSLAYLRSSRQAIALSAAVAAAGAAVVLTLAAIGPGGTAPSEALASNPELDPGTPLSRPAPDFALNDQFGQQISLRSFRGKVVLLAFNDSECTTVCPLTTTAMLDAKAMLGADGDRVQLLGVDANPKATSLEDVVSYSNLHGMLHAWHFLTGSLAQLRRVWKAYGIEAQVEAGEIAHTPALFVIDPHGRLRRLHITQQSYAAVGQLGQLLAREASGLLPGHPAVHSGYSYSQISGIDPSAAVTLPRAGGGNVRLGPGRPHLYLFFATWDRQITGLAAGLEGLGRYSAIARREGLPPVEAVDEASVEPAGALSRFLGTLSSPLPYPVALDGDGRVGDGYQVEGLPWLMAVNAAGRISWYYSVATQGWPRTSYLITRIREALARAPAPPAGLAARRAELAGSPPALQALHQQASTLLGAEPALAARIRDLRGYPIVINAWASWCGPCRSEFGLFASASARYGRKVAFLGADTNDPSPEDARAFLAAHPISYPSYQTSTTNFSAISPGGLADLPTTIFINRMGKVVSVHIGQYDAQGTLDGDIETYALGG